MFLKKLYKFENHRNYIKEFGKKIKDFCVRMLNRLMHGNTM